MNSNHYNSPQVTNKYEDDFPVLESHDDDQKVKGTKDKNQRSWAISNINSSSSNSKTTKSSNEDDTQEWNLITSGRSSQKPKLFHQQKHSSAEKPCNNSFPVNICKFQSKLPFAVTTNSNGSGSKEAKTAAPALYTMKHNCTKEFRGRIAEERQLIIDQRAWFKWSRV